jgi:hypothetical protein
MTLLPKENFNHPDLKEYQKRVDSEVALSEIKSYFQSIFTKQQDTLSGLNMQLHLLRDMDFSLLDPGQKTFLSGFWTKLKTLSQSAASGKMAVEDVFPDISPFSDTDFSSFITIKKDEFALDIHTLDQVTDEEVFDTVDTEFRFLFASAERCISSSILVNEKEELFPLVEELFLSELSLDFLSRFFEKWLQNKGIFLQ